MNHKRVLRIMRKNDLICQIKKVKTRLANSDHSQPVFPNLIKDITVTGINQVWVCDITYICIPTEFVYLAVILDSFSRKVIVAIISHVIWIRILHSQLFVWQ